MRLKLKRNIREIVPRFAEYGEFRYPNSCSSIKIDGEADEMDSLGNRIVKECRKRLWLPNRSYLELNLYPIFRLKIEKKNRDFRSSSRVFYRHTRARIVYLLRNDNREASEIARPKELTRMNPSLKRSSRPQGRSCESPLSRHDYKYKSSLQTHTV